MDQMNEEELTIEDIVNLKSSCSKKVFDNFIQHKYRNQVESKSTEEDHTKKKKSREDLEFEKVFGCERNKSASKSMTDKRVFESNQESTETIDEQDKPEEMTTKFRPRKFREIFKVEENNDLRDPRFDRSSGYFNPKRFEKSYNFIKEARNNDKKLLKKTLKKTNDEERKKEISKVIQRISNQEHEERKQIERQKVKNELIEEKKKMLKSDNKPVYVNKGEIKKKELIETFKSLKQNQKLNKYLERKRKKNTGRERKTFQMAIKE